MAFYDCANEMASFHKKEVVLSIDDQNEMKKRRDEGRKRLKNGLEADGHPYTPRLNLKVLMLCAPW